MKPKDDWHRADIIAELHKCGTSLAAISRSAGLSSSTLSNTLYSQALRANPLARKIAFLSCCNTFSHDAM
ncbi:transcriptional regulator [Salmonella enterica subsp. diarizonae]|nr:transcriptional regulator [Salmonella enterica subsp. diarizonae]EEE1293319.1 transcriptional regulator [Salmonella enterica subsp. diarizonae]